MVMLGLVGASWYAVDEIVDTVHLPPDSRVLVLGSGGLIGRALTNALRSEGYEVFEVKGRADLDLRVPGALARFTPLNISFVYFLACDVGGSKFIDAADQQYQILHSNLAMYQVVFPWLQSVAVPFIFTSSYNMHRMGAYGSIKRLGEVWTNLIPQGQVVRFWNVYGPERRGLRAHVLTDWIDICYSSEPTIIALTNGLEVRQFSFVDDVADSLVHLLEQPDWLSGSRVSAIDIASGQWTSIREVGAIIMDLLPHCNISWSSTAAAFDVRIEPELSTDLHERVMKHSWQRTTLRDGIARMIDLQSKPQQQEQGQEPEDQIDVTCSA
jgi:nucleoside-diphosphate-sugar epimerase